MPTILCIDDNPNVLELLGDFIREIGYNFISTMDGIGATQVVQRQKPDLIIIDYQMPAGDGVTVLKRIERLLNNSKIPAIFLTGSIDIKNLKRMAGTFPNRRFMTKPVQLPLLETYIQELLPHPPPKHSPQDFDRDRGEKTVLDLDAPDSDTP